MFVGRQIFGAANLLNVYRIYNNLSIFFFSAESEIDGAKTALATCRAGHHTM